MRSSTACQPPQSLATETYDQRITLQDLELMQRLLPLVRFMRNDLCMSYPCLNLWATAILTDISASTVSSSSDVETIDDNTSGEEDDTSLGMHRRKSDNDDNNNEDCDDDGDGRESNGRQLLEDHFNCDERRESSSTRQLPSSSERLHVAAEKRYSASVRCKIKTLHNMISSSEVRQETGSTNADVSEKLSKAAILGKAVDHIERLINTYEYYECRYDRLLGISEQCLAALEQ